MKGHPALRNMVRNDEAGTCFFGIENKLGFEGDPTIQGLIRAIDKTAREMPAMKQGLPAGWIAVYDELQALHQASPPRMHLERTELLKIASNCGLPHRPALMGLEKEVRRTLPKA